MKDTDETLARLLRADSPPARDPMFRIRVLEHRERRLLRKRRMMLLAGAAAVALLPAVVLALSGELLAYGAMVAFGAALITACVLAARGVRQALRWWRAHRA